jgi:hypothetical protein
MYPTNLEARDLQWRKARRSANDGACVEVALVNGEMAIRDSKNPNGSRLQYSAQSWYEFVSAVKSEE